MIINVCRIVGMKCSAVWANTERSAACNEQRPRAFEMGDMGKNAFLRF